MQKIWIILLVAGLMVACQPKQQKKTPTEKATSTQLKEVQELELNVEGMTCNGCEKAIESGLLQMDGVLKVKASFQNKKVILTVEKGKINRETVREKIEDIGYSVKE